jgi:hypothetical protein
MPAKLSLITYCIQKYIFLSSLSFFKMEIYNSLQGNIFHIKKCIIHIKKTCDCSQRENEIYSSLQTNIDI